MICPECKKTMGMAVVGNDESDAVYFNNCPDCNIQMDNNGFVLAFIGDTVARSNYNLIKGKKR